MVRWINDEDGIFYIMQGVPHTSGTYHMEKKHAMSLMIKTECSQEGSHHFMGSTAAYPPECQNI